MHSKENHGQNKKTEWEKILANDMTDKKLISKIHKQFIQLNIKKKKKKERKKTQMSRYFSKEDIQMVKRRMKRCSTSLTIREMQIKPTVRYHFTPVQMAIIKKSVNNKWLDCA